MSWLTVLLRWCLLATAIVFFGSIAYMSFTNLGSPVLFSVFVVASAITFGLVVLAARKMGRR